MALPYFYFPALSQPDLTLDEDSSKHIVQVLRMQKGEEILLTDGMGKKCTGVITDDNRKRCGVKLISEEKLEPVKAKLCIAISPTKTAARFEWFLEKVTEIGIREIIPLVCDRTEKNKFRTDRWRNILVSAMLQSQQCWLPELSEPVEFKKLITTTHYPQKFIAHCLEEKKQTLSSLLQAGNDKLVLIGPEGDFSEKEIAMALQEGFAPVTLGNTRLRTETAGIVAATLMVNCFS